MSDFSWADRLPALETERVVLRHPTARDVPDLYAVFSDPRVTRYWSSAALTDLEQARELLEEIERLFRERTLFQWGIALREDDRLIGTATLYRLEDGHRGEIGFALGRHSWGRGLASEAVSRVLDFAFDRLGLHRIEADVDPRNAGSLRLLERLGFVREGLMRQRYRRDDLGEGGELQDAVILGLLRSERPDGPAARASGHRAPRRW